MTIKSAKMESKNKSLFIIHYIIKEKGGQKAHLIIKIKSYFAKSTNLFSLITETLICPGYSILFSIILATS
jgi:membrane-anchored glycerophosphoryl diester phosphodiesterase (GDPDase)